MNTLRSQSGHALVVIIIVASVALVGVLGFVFWQNFVNKSDTTKTTEVETINDEKGSEKTLPIVTWGVAFALKDELDANDYIVGTVSAEDEPTKIAQVVITNVEKDAIYPGCGERTILRSSDEFKSVGTTFTIDEDASVKIGKFSYAIPTNQTACYEKAPADQQLSLSAKLKEIPDDLTVKNLSAF